MVDTEVRIVNAVGKDVERNSKEQGEIIVKGSGVMNQQQSNSDGWVHTGDIGTMDEYGQINMIEMNKDITKQDGDHVSSFEVESVLFKHPAVREIVVLATPDPELGDIIQAFIVLNEGYQPTKQELLDFSTKQLPPSDRPKQITFLEELPKTPSGKILRVQLKQHYK